MTGAIQRGLSLSDFNSMTIGQVVDYCITYNELNDLGEDEEEKPKTRIASQEDWDRFAS